MVPLPLSIPVTAVVSFVEAGIACLWSTLAAFNDVPAEALSQYACVLGAVVSNSSLSALTVSPLATHCTLRFQAAGATTLGANQCLVVLALLVVTSVVAIVASVIAAGIACLWSLLAATAALPVAALSPYACVLGAVASNNALFVYTVSQLVIPK